MTIVAVAHAATRATGRQRGDGSRPVGNSRRVNTSVRLVIAYHHHPVYQAPTITANDDPRPVS